MNSEQLLLKPVVTSGFVLLPKQINVCSSECAFMYFKFYVRILGGRMSVVASFQIHMKMRIQDQDLLRTALPRDLRMVQVCSSRLQNSYKKQISNLLQIQANEAKTTK